MKTKRENTSRNVFSGKQWVAGFFYAHPNKEFTLIEVINGTRTKIPYQEVDTAITFLTECHFLVCTGAKMEGPTGVKNRTWAINPELYSDIQTVIIQIFKCLLGKLLSDELHSRLAKQYMDYVVDEFNQVGVLDLITSSVMDPAELRKYL